MVARKFRPTTLSRREMTIATFEEVTTNVPEKSFLVPLNKGGGRNAQGKVTVRHHDGGARGKYKIIDFRRNKDGVPAEAATIGYGPDKTACIASVIYVDGEKRYIVAPVGLKVGGAIVSGPGADIKVNSALPLKNIPVDTFARNIELQVGKGVQMIRSAGTTARLVAKEGNHVTLRLSSDGMRYARIEYGATVDIASNTTSDIVSIDKADRKRHMRWRPTVRGSVMNPNDHPHGGGEDRSPIGRPSPVIPWGKPALGYETRENKKYSDRFIIERRSDK